MREVCGGGGEKGWGVFIFAVWTEAGQPTDISQILSLAISI